MSKRIIKAWVFKSSSDPDRAYETLKYDDGTTSCNCRGWTQQPKGDGSRSCTHTRKVDMNIADHLAVTFSEYTEPRPAEPAPATRTKTKTKQPEVKPGTRKFAI